MLREYLFNKKNITLWILLVLMAWLSNLVVVVIPYAHQIVIDQLATNKMKDFHYFLLILLALYAFEIIEGYFYEYKKSCFQERIKQCLRIKINEHVLYLKHNYFINNGKEKIISRYTKDTVTIATFYGDLLIELLGNICMFVAVVFFIARSNISILMLSLAVIIIYFAMTSVVGKMIKKEVKFFLLAEEEALGVLSENCNAEVLIKVYNLYKKCKCKYEERYANAYRSRKKTALLFAANTSGARLILYILQGVVFAIAGMKVLTNEITVGSLVSMVEYQSFLLMPLFFWGQFNSKYQEYINSRDRLEELLSEESEKLDIKDSELEIKDISKIEIVNLNFSYRNDIDVLTNVSLSFEKGNIIGIIGQSGIGKSTLIKLLLGLYLPPKDTIYIDGADFSELTLARVRSCIGYVPQDSLFFNESIIDNLFCADIDFEKIDKLCKVLDIDNEIQNMENGFDTLVGVDGNMLSGGQRKRLDFLRVFYMDKPVLIFDEPTAMLDENRRFLFYKYLIEIKSDKIIIVISHNISEVQYFDCVYEINKGVSKLC